MAEADVDIQLFDTEDASQHTEGAAIIAYCDEDGCNKGMLGNNDGTAESTDYNNLTYEYSGKLLEHVRARINPLIHVSMYLST